LRAIAREDAGIWPSRDYASIRFVDTGDAADFTFSGFVLSLATSAAVQFGDIADPSTGQPAEPNLEGAARIIDILSMLQEKTRGNLIPEEAQLLDDLLYELRLRFVQAQEGEKRIIEP
jgi:hypothetical protein